MLEVLGAERLRSLLSMESAIDAVDAMFAAPSLPDTPPRTHLAAGTGELLLMPSAGSDAVGVKIAAVNPTNPPAGLALINGVYVLFDPSTLVPVLVIDAAELTAMRTAAVSGMATRHLATEGASRLVVFGAGVQARSHVEAMSVVRPVGSVTVVGRSSGRAEALVEDLRARGLEASVGTPEAVEGADLVCTCTTSPAPVFDGRLLAEGAHVNAVGAYRIDERELDDETMGRARIFVEDRQAAMAEAGDIVVPLRRGVISAGSIAGDLVEVARGSVGRGSDREVTVFKSVGAAHEDLAVAGAAARALGAIQ